MAIYTIDVYQYHSPKKITQKFHPQPYFFQYICKFSNFVRSIILSQIYFMHSKFATFFGHFKILEYLSINLIKYT